MANNIHGIGTRLTLVCDQTYPLGVTLSQFADDGDSIDIGSVAIGSGAMGANGDFVTWTTAVAIPLTINLIPDSVDDKEMTALAIANRAEKGKAGVRDKITATIVYPDGSVVVLTDGIITGAQLGSGFASSGRLKSKTYSFMFGGIA